jgi:transposase-like protein
MKRKKQKTLEDLFPDPELRKRVKDQLYSGNPLFGEGSVFTEMLEAMVNASLEGEMDHFLSGEKKTLEGKSKKNRRNGHGTKRVRSSSGELFIQPPRDRHSEYEPILIGKRERELKTGLDDVILSLYAKGQSIDDVRQQLRQIYGLDMSAGAISAVTDRVWTEVLDWQQRPLYSCYVVIYLDAVHFRVRQEGKVDSKAVYTVYGVNAEGQRDVLGLYVDEAEGARNWGLILEDLKRRGVETILFCCVDGLKGFKEVIEEVFPCSIVQRCIVHMIRTSTRFVSDKDRRELCADLRKIYTAANRAQAELALQAFGQKWDKKYKEIRPKWEKNWESLMAFMDYGAHIRRMIYTTNPVEAIHRVMRKVTKSKGAWINDKGLIKQLYLTLKYNEKSWKRKAFHWVAIQKELIDKFGERYNGYLPD